MNKWTVLFKQDLPTFFDAADKFYKQEMKPNDYKAISGGFGNYGERGAKSTMIRCRFSGGVINKNQLLAFREAIKTYHVPMVHFTTCQCLQLHHITGDIIEPLMNELYDNNILTRGAGSDNPRNITSSGLIGIEKDEYFDVTGYMNAVSEYLLGTIGTVKYPRKMKVSFSSSNDGSGHTRIRDLGYLANTDGTFDVYTAGGLGPNPKIGVKVADHIDPKDVLYYAEAMVRIFTEHSDYKTRASNRSRYLPVKLGLEEYLRIYNEYVEEAKKKDLDVINPIGNIIEKTGPVEIINNWRIKPQKQPGLYYVEYHPIGGTPTPEEFIELVDLVEPFEGVELRLAAEETAYIANLTAEEAKTVAAFVDNRSAQTTFEKSVSCVGSTVCQIGVRDSHGLLEAILVAAKPHHFEEGVLPRLYISGCHNSCGTHETASIGFQGAAKLVDKKPVDAFALFVGGNEAFGSEKLGEQVAVIETRFIPEFIVELGTTVRNANTTFDDWIQENQDVFNALVKQYDEKI